MNSIINGYQNDLLGILKKIFDFTKIDKDIENINNPEKKKEEENPPAPVEVEGPAELEAPVVPAQAPVPAQEPAPVPAKVEAPVPAQVEAPAQAPAQVEAPAQAPAEAPVQAPAEAPVQVEAPAQEPAPAPAPAPEPAAAVKNGGGTKETAEFVSLKPELNDEILKTYINSARKIIMDMYINCEKDFLEGIHIFEGIIARTLGFTTQQKLDSLNANILKIYEERK